MEQAQQATADDERSPVVGPSKPRLLRLLGPGLITGASDDDPSGIATYSQAGAQFGYGLPWTMLLTFPLMSAVQMISARMGRTTGRGIAGLLRQHYQTWLLLGIVVPLFFANSVNIGADLGAMSDAAPNIRRLLHLVRSQTEGRNLPPPLDWESTRSKRSNLSTCVD